MSLLRDRSDVLLPVWHVSVQLSQNLASPLCLSRTPPKAPRPTLSHFWPLKTTSSFISCSLSSALQSQCKLRTPVPTARLLANVAARNSTTTAFASPAPADTYWGTFEEVSQYNVSLNYFERLWLAWYTYMNNDVLATGIMSFVMHEVVYFGRALPWIIIDCIPFFNKYKIQAVSVFATCIR